ncbi:MAG: class I SAM-dependent methyltransferase [Solirubrobacteraceae bacterium]
MNGSFSPAWYATFLDSIPAELTEVELAFVERWLPVGRFPFLLDLCCGSGRHAIPLARRGYEVLGVDHDAQAIARARGQESKATFRTHDMRELASLGQRFDGVVNLWHSFGYFDDATNAAVVHQVARALRPGGRALFDVYNREHMEHLPPHERGTRAGVDFETTRHWDGRRRRVTIAYDRGGRDEIEWRLYAPDEFELLSAQAGFEPLVRCAWFDESRTPSPEHTRMQFLVERSEC